jgi:hypothetical protein
MDMESIEGIFLYRIRVFMTFSVVPAQPELLV